MARQRENSLEVSFFGGSFKFKLRVLFGYLAQLIHMFNLLFYSRTVAKVSRAEVTKGIQTWEYST